MAFEQFPYADLHDLNLDWILRKIREMEEQIAALEARVTALEEA